MIYIHVPFCHRKCIYCAFYSVRNSEDRLRSYVDALLAETEQRRSGLLQRPVRTVYFGGGTPSFLPVEELGRIVEGLHRWFDLSHLEEMTIEANPEDLTPQYLSSIIRLGFNRLSIGIQSLDDSMLRFLNRRHSVRQALDAVEEARRAGFRNISVDFIYGFPGKFELPEIPEGVTHVSAYSLTVEPGTALALQVERGRVHLPDDDEVVRQYHALRSHLVANGFSQYEISNYARPGFESKHNSRYWDRTPYLGLGPAAHSFDGLRRRWNVSNVEEYIAGYSGRIVCGQPCPQHKRLFEEETLTADDAYNEMLMTSLRTTRGLPLASVPESMLEELQGQMQPYVECGWIERTQHAYCPTVEGLLHADAIASALFR